MNIRKILYPLTLICVFTYVHAGTYYVTESTDDGTGSLGTLSWAINQANLNTPSSIYIGNTGNTGNKITNIDLTGYLPTLEQINVRIYGNDAVINYAQDKPVFTFNQTSGLITDLLVHSSNAYLIENGALVNISGSPQLFNSSINVSNNSGLTLNQYFNKDSKGSINFSNNSNFTLWNGEVLVNYLEINAQGQISIVNLNTKTFEFRAPMTFTNATVNWDGSFKSGTENPLTLSGSNTFNVYYDLSIPLLNSTGSGNTLTIQGQGKTILNGEISYDGSITLGDGSNPSELTISNNGASKQIDNTDFIISQASTLKFSNSLSSPLTVNTNLAGSGTLKKLGPGTLNLNLQNENNFNGIIDVDKGVMTITPTSSTLPPNIINPSNIYIAKDSYLILDIKDEDSYANESEIVADGKLIKKGFGDLTLSYPSKIKGNLEIDEGTIILGSDVEDKALNTSIFIDVVGILDADYLSEIKSVTGFGILSFENLAINTPFQDEFFGRLMGPSITMNGAGALILGGDLNKEQAQLNFMVDNGTMKINGDYSLSEVKVNSNGILGGSGTVYSVTNLGIVNPGNSIGILHIDDDYTDYDGNGSGTLEIEVESLGKVDQLIIGGVADLNGTLNISKFQGSHIGGKQYLILDAEGGIYEGWTNTYLPPKTSLVQEGNQIYLHVDANQIFADKTISGTNPIIVADYLEKNLHLASLGLLDYIGAMDYMPNDALNNILDKLHPGQFSAIGVAQESMNAQQAAIFTRHANSCCDCSSDNNCPKVGNYLWIQPLGNTLNVTPGHQLQSFYNNSYGVVLGIERFFSNSLDIGASLGYVSSSLHWNNNYAKASMNDLFAALYLDYIASSWYINSSLKGGIDFIQTRRNLNFSATTLPVIDGKILDFKPVYVTALGHPKSYEIATHLESGLDMSLLTGCLTPYIALDVLGFLSNGFEESEAGPLDLFVDHKNYWYLRSFIGVEFNRTFVFSKGSICPNVSLGYTNIQTFASDHYTANFTGIQDTFTVIAENNNWSLISPGFSLNYQHKNGSSIGGSYRADIWKNYWSNYFDLTIAYKF